MEVSTNNKTFKIVIVGEPNAGKTSLIRRYVNNEFRIDHVATIGVDFLQKTINWNEDTSVKLLLWDIGGQERFLSSTPIYYRGAQGCVIVFDVASKLESSLEGVLKWKADIDSKATEKIPCILIANKVDLIENFNPTEYDHFCLQNGFESWYPTSVKNNNNVAEPFSELTKLMMNTSDSIPYTPNFTNEIVKPHEDMRYLSSQGGGNQQIPGTAGFHNNNQNSTTSGGGGGGGVCCGY